METNDGSIPSIVMTKFVERDGTMTYGSPLRSWTVELYPDPHHRLSRYIDGQCLSCLMMIDIRIYTTENVRYMKALQLAEAKWIEHWKLILDDLSKDNFILGGSL